MKYDGSCHCGKIAFTVDAGDAITEVYDCNCSMCRRRGGLLWFAPAAALTLHTDRADLGTYQFNKKHIDHHHCPVCGIAPFSEGRNPGNGEAMVAVNVRCLPELDLATLTVKQVDGASV